MNSAAPKVIVLARPDRIGDVVITSSCLGTVRTAFPAAKIYLLAQERMRPLFWQHPALDGFLAMPEKEDEARRRKILAEELRSLGVDCIVHLHGEAEIEHAAAEGGIARRIGFGGKGHSWLTEPVVNRKKLGEKHEGFYNFDLLKNLGLASPKTLEPQLAPEPVARERVAKKLASLTVSKKYAVLHLGAHGSKPRIAAPFFAAAAKWLAGEGGCEVVLIGDARDETLAANIREGVGRGVHWLGTLGDLAEMAWLLKDAALVFGRDSGPAHLAAAMGAPTVTLMLEPEPENSSRRWHPLGPRSTVLEKPLRRRLLESRAAFARRNLGQYEPQELGGVLRSSRFIK